MDIDIVAVVDVDDDDPSTVLLGFYSPDVPDDVELDLPKALLPDLDHAVSPFAGLFVSEHVLDAIRASAQAVLDKHKGLGNLNYVPDVGFMP